MSEDPKEVDPQRGDDDESHRLNKGEDVPPVEVGLEEPDDEFPEFERR